MGESDPVTFYLSAVNSFYCSHRAIKRQYAQRSGRPTAKLQIGEMPSMERIFISRGVKLPESNHSRRILLSYGLHYHSQFLFLVALRFVLGIGDDWEIVSMLLLVSIYWYISTG